VTQARASRLTKMRAGSGSPRLSRCSRRPSSTRPDTASALESTAASTASASGPAARSSLSTERNSRPGETDRARTAAGRSPAASASSTRPASERTRRSPRATAKTSCACGSSGYSCGCSRSPRRFHRSRCRRTSPTFAGTAPTTDSSAVIRPLRSGRGSDRNRVGSPSDTSPPARAQASRSTSVIVSTSSGRSFASRTRLTTARFSRTGISSGCSPSTHQAARTSSSRRSASPSGTVLAATARYSARASSSSGRPRWRVVTRSFADATNASRLAAISW